jgi:dTDP-4-amino-4,6-dideoxygalactose transaminase
MKQSEKSDFRYSTGNAKVPWDAVAVKPDTSLVMDVVRFLIGPGADATAYAAAASKVAGAVEELYRHGQPATKLSLGAQVKAVEDSAKQYLGCKHAAFVVNWTAGYDIALDLAGVRAGDEVIIPAITFIATAAPVLRKGARIVFADVQRDTVNMDPADVARKITPRTKAIVPVHMGGYPVDMDPLMALAKKKGIAVIEDAAHGFGGTYKGQRLGTIGDFGAYSFHEVKNITSLGEGGIGVTNSDLGAQFAKGRFCGFDLETPPPRTWLYNISPIYSKDGHAFVPSNFSTTEIQAVALLNHIRRNDEIIAQRRAVARKLHDAFSNVPGLLPGPLSSPDYGSTCHLFLLRIDPKVIGGGIQPFKQSLAKKGVTQIAHFCPLYYYKLFHELGYDEAAIAASCPKAEQVFFEHYTHLPLYGLSENAVNYMIESVTQTAKELRTK